MHLDRSRQPLEGKNQSVFTVCSQQVLRHHEKLQQNKLRDNLKCQSKCQSLAVVHITVLRWINGSESDKQENNN